VRARSAVPRRARRNRILKDAKGQRGGRHRQFKLAMETVRRGRIYAFDGRRLRKRDFRSLWIVRIGAALDGSGLSYSRFINGLRRANVPLDRKMISEMAIHDRKAFDVLVTLARQAVAGN
jgi:large subunit ribosomal protein L20